MHDIREVSVDDLVHLRRGAPSMHPLDDMAGSIHLGIVEGESIVGGVTGYPVDPRGRPDGRSLRLNGPFGIHGEALVEALATRSHGPGTVWSEGARPGLSETESGRWERPFPDPPPVTSSGEADYSSQSIRILEGVQPIVMRPKMYVGSTDGAGIQVLIREVLDNVIDEHLAGFASTLWIDRGWDGTWTIADDGRGIPVDLDPTVLHRILTRLHAGSTFDRHRPHVHSGLHGVGLAVVNALSERTRVTVDRPTGTWEQLYRWGYPVTPPVRVGDSQRTGTTIAFTPCREIFTGSAGPLDDILTDVAYLNPRLRVLLQGRDLSQPDGLLGMARDLAQGRVLDTLVIEGQHDGAEVALAIAWIDGPGSVRMFANQLHLSEEGSVVDAARVLLHPTGPCVLVGNLMLQEPHYHGRTTHRLDDPRAVAAVETLLGPALAAR